MNHRSLRLIAAFAAAGVILMLAPRAIHILEPTAEADTRPNIILLMVDDLDVGSLDAAIESGYMPNLASTLLAGGTTFTESFVTLSLCCPSRSTALTGQYPHNHGVIRNSGQSGGFDRFDDGSTLATWLQDGGYHTGHVGKYLNGYRDVRYVPPGWDRWQGLVDPSTYCMYGYTISDDGEPVAYGDDASDYQTDVLAARSREFIESWHERGDSRPFYLSIAPLAPHLESSCNRTGIRPAPRHAGSVDVPLPMPPSFNELSMNDKPTWMRELPFVRPMRLQVTYNDRIAALRAVDDLIGGLARELADAGVLDRTAFLFTSDNGYLLGQHRWRTKVLLYEESIRVPLIVRLPGGGGPESVGALVLNNDLAPTIAALATVSPGLDVDGRSLLPLLRDASTSWRQRFLVEYPPAGESIGIPPFFAVRDSRGLVYGETMDFTGTNVTDIELYDLATDPFQRRSLHASPLPRHEQDRRILKTHLERLKDCGGGTCQTLEQ
jgi:arylsulfatase A-like enzyme